MFGRKKGNQPVEQGPSARDILNKKIAQEVEALTPGQAVIYQIPEFYSFARFLGVELNPMFPQKGKKYLMFTDQVADGKPVGKRSEMCTTNNALEYAVWVSERDNDTYGHVKRVQ
jgi:hypothetical protein